MRSLLVLGLVGFFAQLVDGSLGMAYGVTSSTLLLATGVAPAAAWPPSTSPRSAPRWSPASATTDSATSDWRPSPIIAVPGGGIGAFAGATFLSNIDGDTAKPWVAGLLLALGVYVLYRFLRLGGRRPQFRGKVAAPFLVPLGLVAGLMDAIGGGGWGPVGTPTLLASGRMEPRKVIGSIDTSEFVVAVGGSLGFLLALGSQGIRWEIAAALLVGGVIAAPVAAWLVRHIAPRVLGVAAGGLIILTNAKTILEALGASGSMVAVSAAALFVAWVVLIVWAVKQERIARTAPEQESVPV